MENILLAIVVVLLGALGTITLFLNNQTWKKLDRITALFLHERDELNKRIDTLNSRAADNQANIAMLQERMRK